jgi:hypothetical protein
MALVLGHVNKLCDSIVDHLGRRVLEIKSNLIRLFTWNHV